ncbi:hypothetical protein [Haladaptatus sp. DFWS20]|uniref:hypothetical protein n=1 Tax=Haladaptatus sp. DFWS20 TaxID=3403467 RepID=UPI003EC01FA1
MRPSSETKALLSISVGLVLLLNPLYIGLLHLDDPTYRYQQVEVEFTDGGYRTDERSLLGVERIDSDVACLRGYPTRACQFERFLYNGGNGSVPTNYRFRHAGRDYSAVFVNGQFYRPRGIERNGTWYMTLEPASKEEVLKGVTTPYADAPVSIRHAVRTGNVSTHREIEMTNELVRKDGTYSVIRLADKAEASNSKRLLHYLFLVGGVVVGFFHVLRGQRLRVDERRRNSR